MATRLQVPVLNTLTVDKARKLLESVQRKVTTGDIREPEQLLSALFKAFEDLFSRMDQPLSEQFEIRSEDIRLPGTYTGFLRDVASDIDVMMSSLKSLTDASVQAFNLSTVKSDTLRNEVRKVTSSSADIQLLDDNLGSGIMVAGDDFSDDRKVDQSFPIDGLRCEVMPEGFGISLRRLASVNLIDAEKASVQVEMPKDAYEGLYYAPLGSAEPEGDKFHWEETHHEHRPGSGVPKASAHTGHGKTGQTSDKHTGRPASRGGSGGTRSDSTGSGPVWDASKGEWV